MLHDPIPAGLPLGVGRGLTYGLHREPDVFMPQVRALGARTVRVYLYWSQIEPEPGRFVWDAVDALIDQLEDSDEVWLTVYSTSTWATRHPNRTLPASPARDLNQYRRFVRELVTRCRGRVLFWQCDNEPCVNFLWQGTAAEYLGQLEAFWQTVKEVDPAGLVVIGGAPPDALPVDGERVDEEAIEFYDELIRDGGAYFDVFDIHPYGNPYVIPAVIETCHRVLAGHGHRKPVAIGEYNGPFPFELPELRPRLSGLLAGVMDEDAVQAPGSRPTDDEWQQTGEPHMVALYRRMTTLPPLMQMFMVGCPAELEDKRHRWNCRDLVMRNLLALSAGVRRTVCWQLAPDRPGHRNPYQIMELLFGKFNLMDYEGELIGHRYPAADAMALLADRLDGVREVRRIEVPEQPNLYLFEVDRLARGPLLVVWERRDDFDGEDKPSIPFDWDWSAPAARAVDALGTVLPAEVRNGRVHLPVSLAPIFID